MAVGDELVALNDVKLTASDLSGEGSMLTLMSSQDDSARPLKITFKRLGSAKPPTLLEEMVGSELYKGVEALSRKVAIIALEVYTERVRDLPGKCEGRVMVRV